MAPSLKSDRDRHCANHDGRLYARDDVIVIGGRRSHLRLLSSSLSSTRTNTHSCRTVTVRLRVNWLALIQSKLLWLWSLLTGNVWVISVSIHTDSLCDWAACREADLQYGSFYTAWAVRSSDISGTWVCAGKFASPFFFSFLFSRNKTDICNQHKKTSLGFQ